MLIFKLLAAQKKAQPTLIFDEIDTGISGKIAGKMGSLLSGTGTRMQIMAITHLPQIASKGNRHFKVEKIQGTTRIRELNYEERIAELAGMLSAEVTTENALEHARELLNSN
jgi:DNA repair protein RecN (Recombination protein N)